MGGGDVGKLGPEAISECHEPRRDLINGHPICHNQATAGPVRPNTYIHSHTSITTYLLVVYVYIHAETNTVKHPCTLAQTITVITTAVCLLPIHRAQIVYFYSHNDSAVLLHVNINTYIWPEVSIMLTTKVK